MQAWCEPDLPENKRAGLDNAVQYWAAQVEKSDKCVFFLFVNSKKHPDSYITILPRTTL